MTEPKRPYYDAEAADKHQAGRLAALRAVLRAAFGPVIVRRPSDATMKLIEEWKRHERTHSA